MTSMKFLDEHIGYDENPISYAREVHVGDQFIFISTKNPPGNTHLHEKVVTVAHVSSMGGLAVREHYDTTSHFIRECFHEIVYEEMDMSEFESVFE